MTVAYGEFSVDSHRSAPQANAYTAGMMMTTDHHPDWIDAANRLLGEDITVHDATAHTVHTGDAPVQIRLWPPDTTIDRVQAVREALSRVPRTTGIPHPVGEADAAVLIGGRVYDACTTIDGLPLNRHGIFTVKGHGAVSIPLHQSADHGDMLVQAARVIAEAHSATQGKVDPARAGSLSARATYTAAKARWLEARKKLGREAEDLSEVRRWLRCGNRIIPIADDRLRAAGPDATDTPVLIHGDIWPAWLIVDDPSRPRTLNGIAGWPHAVTGSPVIDLAALCGRITGWSAANVEDVLGAYSEHADLSPGARRIVPVVAAVDLLDQLGRLLNIAFIDDDVANDPAQPFIRGGVAVLLRSLEHLTSVLAPPEPNTRTQRGPRTGYRSPRPAGRTRSDRRSRKPSGRRRREEG